MIRAALDRGADVTDVYFGYVDAHAFPELVRAVAEADIPIHTLKEGVLEKLGTTRTPQPVLAVAEWEPRAPADLVGAASDSFLVVTIDVADPGNLGTILRSAEAAGAAGVIVAGTGVDVRSPKVVRASAGALFGVPVAEAPDVAAVLDLAQAADIHCLGAVARGGADPAQVALSRGCAVVVGNEAHGISSAVAGRLDGTVTIPMAGAAESLNVAMAATILCFEAARQRGAPMGEAGR